MMKRPRSFISTLLIFLSLATVTLGLTVKTHDANAGAFPRLMDPRAGDPDEPDPGLYQPGGSIPSPPGEETLTPIQPAPRQTTNWFGSLWRELGVCWNFLSHSHFEGR